MKIYINELDFLEQHRNLQIKINRYAKFDKDEYLIKAKSTNRFHVLIHYKNAKTRSLIRGISSVKIMQNTIALYCKGSTPLEQIYLHPEADVSMYYFKERPKGCRNLMTITIE